ncbi:MAG: hypothetical protein AB8B89_01275 [Gammaproteobacteria bacterium]
MKNILLMIVILTMSSLGLVGCNANATKDAETLRSKAKAYGKLIRWKAYDDAVGYIKLRDGGVAEVNTDLLNEIRVTRYEVASMVMNEKRDEATVTAEISYYHERANSVHEIKDKQIWWKEESSGAWYLDGQLPPFAR